MSSPVRLISFADSKTLLPAVQDICAIKKSWQRHSRYGAQAQIPVGRKQGVISHIGRLSEIVHKRAYRLP